MKEIQVKSILVRVSARFEFSEGSSCRESTVKVKFSRTLADERLLIAAFCKL